MHAAVTILFKITILFKMTILVKMKLVGLLKSKNNQIQYFSKAVKYSLQYVGTISLQLIQ